MGKSAIDAKRVNGFALDPNDITIIGLDTDDGPDHPLFDERIKLPVNEPLALNIRVNGVIEPVQCRKNGDTIEVVNGRQRVRAARLANEMNRKEGLEPILVTVVLRRGADESMMGVMISANELRQADVMATKLKKLERFMSIGRSEEGAAIAFGVSVATIKQWLALMEAGPEVKKAFAAGLLSATAAAKLAAIPRAEQADAVAEATKDGKATVQAAQRATKTAKAAADGETASETVVPPQKRLLKRLVKNGALKELREGPKFEDGFRSAIQWMLGEMASGEVDGLAAAIEKASA
jgi:ParB family chromosome partitioning protein